MTIIVPAYILWLVAWLLSGFIGSCILYKVHCMEFRTHSCLTPIGVIGFIVGTLFGVCVFGASLIVFGVIYMEHPNWWNTPICKKRLTNDD